MTKIIRPIEAATLLAAMLLTMASCESDDERLAQQAQRAAEQQARQSERVAQQTDAMVKHNHEMTAAAHDLVKHDAAARRELIEAQEKIQHQNHLERESLDRERQELVAEQRVFAQAAVQNPVIGQAVVSGSLILAALLPLLVTLYALRRLPEHRPVDDLIGDGLLEEVLLLNPVTIQPPPAACTSIAGHQPSPLLGPATDSDSGQPPPF